MRKTTPIHIRISPAETAGLDELVERDGGNRGRKVREGVALLLSLEAQAQLLVEAVREVVRVESRAALKELVSAAQASDATSRDLINATLEAIGEVVSAPATTGHPKTSAPAPAPVGPVIPRRREA